MDIAVASRLVRAAIPGKSGSVGSGVVGRGTSVASNLTTPLGLEVSAVPVSIGCVIPLARITPHGAMESVNLSIVLTLVEQSGWHTVSSGMYSRNGRSIAALRKQGYRLAAGFGTHCCSASCGTNTNGKRRRLPFRGRTIRRTWCHPDRRHRAGAPAPRTGGHRNRRGR